MGLVGLYILGDWSAITGGALSAYQTMMVIFMVITVAYLSLSGMLGATKNMVLQYVILIVAFLLGLVVTGWSGGFTTVLPQLEYGMMIDTLGASSPPRSRAAATTCGSRPVSAWSSGPVDCPTCWSGSTRSRTSESPAGRAPGGCSSSRCCTSARPPSPLSEPRCTAKRSVPSTATPA